MNMSSNTPHIKEFDFATTWIVTTWIATTRGPDKVRRVDSAGRAHCGKNRNMNLQCMEHATKEDFVIILTYNLPHAQPDITGGFNKRGCVPLARTRL